MLKKVRNGNQLHVSLPRNPGTRMHTDTLRGREDNSRDKNERRQTLLSQMQKPSCDKIGQHHTMEGGKEREEKVAEDLGAEDGI